MSGASGWQAQLMRITQTSARANGAVPGLSPGKSGFKAYRLILTGATPMRLASVSVSSLNLQRGEVARPKAKWGQKTAPNLVQPG